MRIKHLLFGLICYSACISADTYVISSKPQEKPAPPKGEPKEQEEECLLDNPPSFRFSVSHREGKGIGYNDGYSSFDGFFTFTSIENWHPFFDARVHLFDDFNLAANAGFGLRYQPSSVNAIFGINGFFDFRNTGHSIFEQAGFGLEALGSKWAGRINAYFPVFDSYNLYDVSFSKFTSHQALFTVKQEVSFKGFDASLQRTLLQRQYYSLSSTLGGYMFFADFHKKAQGGLIKLDADISRYFSVQVQGSYDSLFKGILQAQAGLNLPFGKKVSSRKKRLSCKNKIALADRITESVDRFEIIVTDHQNEQSVAQHPATKEDLYIVFVDNTKSGGNGTAEAPYGTLLDAQNNSLPNQMIYVYAGTGTTTGMSSGIVLKDKQWLQGSGKSFVALTSYGVDVVPSQTSGWPTIGNTAGDTITLANGNIIAGLNVLASNNCVSGFNITDLTAVYNTFATAPLYDFTLTNVSGVITIGKNNSLSKNGLYLNTTKDVTLNLESNYFTNSGSQNFNLQFSGTSNSQVSMKLNSFQLCQNGSTIATQGSSRLTLNMQSNKFLQIKDTASYAVQTSASNLSNLIAVYKNNQFTGPSLKGFDFLTTGSATSFLYVEDNTGTYSGSSTTAYPFNFLVNSSGTSNLYLSGNSANASGYQLCNFSILSTFNVQSPTLSLSGLESLNTGSFTVDTCAGPINYISYTPSSVPNLD